jgi:hypothetical protein
LWTGPLPAGGGLTCWGVVNPAWRRCSWGRRRRRRSGAWFPLATARVARSRARHPHRELASKCGSPTSLIARSRAGQPSSRACAVSIFGERVLGASSGVSRFGARLFVCASVFHGSARVQAHRCLSIYIYGICNLVLCCSERGFGGIGKEQAGGRDKTPIWRPACCQPRGVGCVENEVDFFNVRVGASQISRSRSLMF